VSPSTVVRRVRVARCVSAHFSLPPLSFSRRPPPPGIYTLSLHDALPISRACGSWISNTDHPGNAATARPAPAPTTAAPRTSICRSEEHTSELQSRFDLVCRLLLEKKNDQRAANAGDRRDDAERHDAPLEQ